MRPPDLPADFLAILRSPENGRPLTSAGPGLLSDGQSLWPCVEGIPYLRRNRDALRRAAVTALSDGQPCEALAILLRDRKDASIPPLPHDAAVRAASVASCAVEAMNMLGYGGLSWYMQHRWCQPSFLSGLALLEMWAPQGARLLDLACGTGQYLHRWQQCDPATAAIGADLVFSHLWIARRFVAPHAWLVCFDAEAPFPLADQAADLTFTQDSLHYFTDKPHVIAEMRRLSRDHRILLGHVHNAEHPNLSAGTPLTADAYLALIEHSAAYDDDDLTQSVLLDTPADPASPARLQRSPALAFATGPPPPQPVRMTLPPAGTALRLNPLLATGRLVWPDPKFQTEFADPWPYLHALATPSNSVLARAAAGGIGSDPELDHYARQQVLLDLPEGWL
ncbi:MAG: class I SAM-dependent methyltransferase [Dermatophilaceae bacterium]